MRMESRNYLRIIVLVIITAAFLLSTAAVAADGPSWIGAFFVKGKVGLKWKPVEGAESYNVYRKVNDGEFVVINALDKTHCFDVNIVPGTVQTYKIAAVGADGNETFSIEKTVTIPGGQVGEFKPPAWVGLRFDRDKVFANWEKMPGAIAFNILRSETSGSGYEVVGNVTGNRYADRDGMERGKTYYYVLTAMNEEFDETEYSEERSIKFGMSAEEIAAIQAEESEIELDSLPLSYLFEITTAGNLGDMNQPSDVVINSQGNIYISDVLNFRINCYDAIGKYLFSFGDKTPSSEKDDAPEGSFSLPLTLYIDKEDNIYVGDVVNHEIQIFSADGKFLKKIRVTVNADQQELRPNGIALLDDGRMVVTDAGNHRFLIIDQNGKILMEQGGKGREPGQFNIPGQLVVRNDIISIIDILNARVQQFDLTGKHIRSFGQLGDGIGQFGRPVGIADDDTGRIWISDIQGHIVQVFSAEGEIKSFVRDFGREDVSLATPRGMTIKNGKFYIINRLPHRLLVFNMD